MHEFVLKGKRKNYLICFKYESQYWELIGLLVLDVAAQQFREIKGIHTILNGLLGAEEIYISRVVLRTIKFMAYGQGRSNDNM